MSPIPEPLELAVDDLSQDWQGTCFRRSSSQQSHSETMCHSGGRSDPNSPLVAITTLVFTPASTLCGPSCVLSIPLRSVVTTWTEIDLGWKVVPFARMEALMQHYKSAGFFQKRSLGLPQHLEDPQPIAYMTTGGFAPGLQSKDLIRLVPQLLE